MKLTDESKAFHHAVYTVVNQIPYGRATSYGHIAYLLGKPQNSRQVGSSLKHCKEITRQLNEECLANDNTSDLLDPNHLPWWRVLSSGGKISPRAQTNGEIVQGQLLRNEGVTVKGDSIDMEEFGWFPDDVDI